MSEQYNVQLPSASRDRSRQTARVTYPNAARYVADTVAGRDCTLWRADDSSKKNQWHQSPVLSKFEPINRMLSMQWEQHDIGMSQGISWHKIRNFLISGKLQDSFWRCTNDTDLAIDSLDYFLRLFNNKRICRYAERVLHFASCESRRMNLWCNKGCLTSLQFTN